MKRLWLILVLALLVSGTAKAEEAKETLVYTEGGYYYTVEGASEDKTFVDWSVDGKMVSKQEFLDANKARFQADKEKFEDIKERGEQYTDEQGNLGYKMPDGTLRTFCNADSTGTVTAEEFIQMSTAQQEAMLSEAEKLPDISVAERTEMLEAGQTLNEHEEAKKVIKALREQKEKEKE